MFISCTNLPTLEIVTLLERDLDKPVTSNTATLWAALRRVGVREPIESAGRLLAGR